MLPSKRAQNWLPSIINDFLGNEWITKGHHASPAINIIENEQEYRVEFAAPGFDKEDLSIKISEDNTLVIIMNSQKESPEIAVEQGAESSEKVKDERYLRREFSYSKFKQTLILPENINKEAIDAKWNNGILSISIPKIDKNSDPSAKSIEIK